MAEVPRAYVERDKLAMFTAERGPIIRTSERLRAPIEKSGLWAQTLVNNTVVTFKEHAVGGQIKSNIWQKLQKEVGDSSEDKRCFGAKLLRFRPRMIGAISAYTSFSGVSFEETVRQGGMEAFYLFWGLASIQDDFIDDLQKDDETDRTLSDRRKAVGEAIFGPERCFYRAAFRLLRRELNESALGQKQKEYLAGKVTGWYRFLVAQESEVIHTPLAEMDFCYSKKYREDQNMMAGRVLVAAMNGKTCLSPDKQQLELKLPRFSFLTQIIDDIADTAEDLNAGRPSFSVGALVEHQDELQKMRELIALRGILKVTPRLLKNTAPQSYRQVNEAFRSYCTDLEQAMGKTGKSVIQLACAVYNYFPYVRNLLYRINPQVANF